MSDLANVLDSVSSLRHVSAELVFTRLFGELPQTIVFRQRSVEILQNFLPEFTCISRVYLAVPENAASAKDVFVDRAVYVGNKNSPHAGYVLETRVESYASPAWNAVSQLTMDNLIAGMEDDDADMLPTPSPKQSRRAVNLHFALPVGADVEPLFEIVGPTVVPDETRLHMLVSDFGELTLRPMDLQQNKTLDLAIHYGEDFAAVDAHIVHSLNSVTSGLYLFYGDSGTGKSTYIKRLLNGDIARKMAYVPIGLIDSLTSPDMLPLLMANKHLILVIEDAEKALISRENIDSSASLVSTILNLTDGFIGTALGISVIATFNTAREKIDEALLRRGRLKAAHEFKELSIAKAQKLIDHLGKKHTAKEPMTLADIYHLDTPEFGAENKPDKVVSGFGRA